MKYRNIIKKISARFNELKAPHYISMTGKSAEKILNDFLPDKGNSAVKNATCKQGGCTCEGEGEEILLSIIIPTYNNARYITDALESVLTQTTQFPFEIIIVDDGSTDNTEDILRQYDKNKAVRIIYQENQGISGARNAGIRYACGRWLFFLDSDDSMQQGAIEALMKTAVKYNADIVEGNYYEVTVSGELHRGRKWHKQTESIVKNEDKLNSLRGFPWGKVIKNTLFEQVQFPEGYYFEDTIMHMILYPMAGACYTINFPVYKYFINPYGITGSSARKKECIDSFYVTNQLLRDREKLGIALEWDDYRFFLGQVRMNWYRTRLMPEVVRRAIFVEHCELNRKYFEKIGNMKFEHEYETIKASLEEKNYRAYIKSM